jgi:hypothetical protein
MACLADDIDMLHRLARTGGGEEICGLYYRYVRLFEEKYKALTIEYESLPRECQFEWSTNGTFHAID